MIVHNLNILCIAGGPPRMRSLIRMVEKTSPTAVSALARHYAQEVQQVAPEGPLLIGGYCEAGRLAFEMADEQRRKGRDVSLLAMLDRFVPEHYPGRVALFCTATGKHNPFHFYREPQRGWARYYSGEVSLYRYSIPHGRVFMEPTVRDFALQLREEIDHALASTDSPARIDFQTPLALHDADYRRDLRAAAPLILEPGSRHELRVTVTNRSDRVWPATSSSGIKLANRWRNHRGYYRSGIDGSAMLERDLNPGESTTVTLRITAPRRNLFGKIDIDLIDEGVAWFQDKGSLALHKPVVVFKGARFLRRLLGRSETESVGN